jgi:hypothetical protein
MFLFNLKRQVLGIIVLDFGTLSALTYSHVPISRGRPIPSSLPEPNAVLGGCSLPREPCAARKIQLLEGRPWRIEWKLHGLLTEKMIHVHSYSANVAFLITLNSLALHVVISTLLISSLVILKTAADVGLATPTNAARYARSSSLSLW